MGSRKSGELPADLARGMRRFQRWRSKRKGKSRIPEALWKVAVQLAQRHGVGRTASQLRLDYYALKKRLPIHQAAPPKAGPPKAAAFVELPMSLAANAAATAGATQCVIELHSRQGARMRVSLQGCPTSDLAELGRTLWETERCCKSPRK